MGEIKVTVPDGKKAEWKELNGVTVLTLVDADNNQQSEYVPDPRPVTERIKTFEESDLFPKLSTEYVDRLLGMNDGHFGSSFQRIYLL